MKLVIDAMGSDNGSTIVKEAIREFKTNHSDVDLVVVGKENELEDIKDICRVVNASEIVPMTAGALEVMRMKDSSMNVALKIMKDENADGIISAGSTGAFLSASTLILKLIPGVKRAALVSPFPTSIKGKKVVILDIGANNENSPEELVQFATIGSLYSKAVYSLEEPSVYLLNNGAEEGKGAPHVKMAYKLLKEANFPGFKGNIEPRYALNGTADVVVCDGFSGNVFLKASEGIAKMMSGMIKSAFKKNLWSKIGYLHVRKGIKEMTETMDYKSTGGAMLLGVNGVVVKAHGSSDGYSFKCAIEVAYKLAKNNIKGKIEQGLAHE